MASLEHHQDVVCPFCSMSCDDLVVAAGADRLEVLEKGCAVATAAFARPIGATEPRVGDRAVKLEEACIEAASVLRQARLPLLAGLGTDTAGTRAAVALAERVGGVLDHMAAPFAGNLRAMQDHGWVTGTLAEVRTRARLVVLIGTGGSTLAPRLAERLLRGRGDRRVVLLGDGLDAPEGAQTIACPPHRLPEAVLALRALVAGHKLRQCPVDGLEALATALRDSPYSAVVWSAADLADAHADLVVGTLAELLKTLNQTTRAVGLPLAGTDNPIGVNQVCSWQTGTALRTSLASGAPDHDLVRFAAPELLASGAVDTILWIASIHDQPPPETTLPLIVLARAGAPAIPGATVTIPVGTPGLDHAGSVYRQDSVVAMPVRALRSKGLPTVAAVLDAIRAHL